MWYAANVPVSGYSRTISSALPSSSCLICALSNSPESSRMTLNCVLTQPADHAALDYLIRHAARAQQIRRAGLLVRRQDGDFLVQLQRRGDPRQLHKARQRHRDVQLRRQTLLIVPKEAAGPRHRAHAVLLQLLAALEDSLIRHFLARKDHLVVDFAQKLELHREIVRPSVHHVAGQRGEPDFLVAEHADRAARHHLAAFLADDCVIRAGIQVSKLSVLFHNHSIGGRSVADLVEQRLQTLRAAENSKKM